MKSLQQININEIQRTALEELNRILYASLQVDHIHLYGSYAREEADSESDIDLLIITRFRLDRKTRHQITDIVFEINLRYGTNISTLVVDRESWNNGLFSILPLRDEILREGVLL